MPGTAIFDELWFRITRTAIFDTTFVWCTFLIICRFAFNDVAHIDGMFSGIWITSIFGYTDFSVNDVARLPIVVVYTIMKSMWIDVSAS